VFTRTVAGLLFDWDAGTDLGARAEALLGVGDPLGVETAGLDSDLYNYLPDDKTWAGLRRYQTRQHIENVRLSVPGVWGQAVASGMLDAGTVALTVDGTRVRQGVWGGQPSAHHTPVAFTVFMVCEPSYPQCFLLRLSGLDTPLR
jgi:hypothetical protein